MAYRYGAKTIEVGAGDMLLFDATVLHGIKVIHSGPVSYLSVVSTLRESAGYGFVPAQAVPC